MNDMLLEALNVVFRFKVGDVVEHIAMLKVERADDEGKLSEILRERSKAKFCIVERIVNQCHGGVQMFYRCRQLDGHTGVAWDTGRYIDLAEFEVRAS